MAMPKQTTIRRYMVKLYLLNLLVREISRREELLECYISKANNPGRIFEQDFMFLDKGLRHVGCCCYLPVPQPR
jgi:hypothetical protein